MIGVLEISLKAVLLEPWGMKKVSFLQLSAVYRLVAQKFFDS